MSHAQPLPMTPRDVLLGFPFGYTTRAPRPAWRVGESPRAALERAVAGALARPPCVVAFSGGRDSSAVLALAVAVARREGLPEPVPVTRLFAGVAEADETEWQELVIGHLGVSEWVREQVVDEMDLVGPLARPRLLRYGVLWSPLLHGDEFFLRHARGGSVLDGEGGDDVLDPRPHRITPLARLVRRGRWPSRRLARAAAGALAPGWLRGRRAGRRGLPAPTPWLRPAAVAQLRAAYGAYVAAEPLDARRSILTVPTRRSITDLAVNRAFFAGLQGTRFVSPLLEPGVVAALAASAGRLGFPDRASALRVFCSDLLPEPVLARRTKAEFNATFFQRHSHAFADAWSGAGVDPELVDPDALRRVWRGPGHNALAAALLQAAWLADHVPSASFEGDVR